jgi:transposase
MILNALVERLQRRSKHDFKGRHFEAALILQAWPDPKDHSTAGKVRLGVITRAGDEALRSGCITARQKALLKESS